jgi:hypothetical protein
MIYANCDILRLSGCGPFVPNVGLFVITELCMHKTDQVMYDRISVFMLDGFLQRLVCPRRLPHLHEQTREMRPGRAMIWPQLCHRAKGLYSCAALIKLECDKPYKEMTFRQIALRFQHPSTAIPGSVETPGLQVLKTLSKGILDPGIGVFGRHADSFLMR